MPRQYLTPGNGGTISASQGIPAPGVGLSITLIGYHIIGDQATGCACYISSDPYPADANILDSLYIGPGYPISVDEYITRPKLPTNTGVFVVATTGSVYGFLEYSIDKDAL